MFKFTIISRMPNNILVGNTVIKPYTMVEMAVSNSEFKALVDKLTPPYNKNKIDYKYEVVKDKTGKVSAMVDEIEAELFEDEMFEEPTAPEVPEPAPVDEPKVEETDPAPVEEPVEEPVVEGDE